MTTTRARKPKRRTTRHELTLPTKARPRTQAQWKRLQQAIDHQFPKGRFVAVDKGVVLADGTTFREVHETLNAMGLTSSRIIVLQSGDDTPDYVQFLL